MESTALDIGHRHKATGPLAAQRHRHVGERARNRRRRLVQRDLGRDHLRVAQADLEQPPRHLFDQIARLALDHGGQPLGQRSIVDGVGQVVGTGGRIGVEYEYGVNHEFLAGAALVLEHTVMPIDLQPRQPNLTRHVASLIAAATLIASTLGRTLCTRTPQAPPRAAIMVSAVVASSRSAAGRGVPSAAASSRPRNDFLDDPTSTGKPSSTRESRWASSAQSCSATFAKPSPGSIAIRSAATPAARAASTRAHSSRRTSATTSSYAASLVMSLLCPRQCIRIHGTPAAASTPAMSGSASPPLTSLITLAPAASAAAATAARLVSTEHGTPAAASSVITGSTRRISSAASTRSAPGRVDSPPTSTRSAPSARIARPCATAASSEAYRPPSENESGVTLRTPMTTQRFGRGSRNSVTTR